MSGAREAFLRLIGQRSASEVADLLEHYRSDQVTLVAQGLVALREHLESAPAWPPIGSATESAEPKASQPDKPGLPRGNDTEENWYFADKLCALFDTPERAAALPAWRQRHLFYVDAARSLIEELDRYRSAPQ
jgi:hypothetical protein